jgi:hypothetical protein
VIVIEDDDVLATCTGFALVVRSLATQAYVLVLVNAGEIPLITALLLDKVAMPPNTRPVPAVLALAHVVDPDVTPQKYAVGIEPDCVGKRTVPAAIGCAVSVVEPDVLPLMIRLGVPGT